MQNIIKKITLLLIFSFSIYCALNIGIHWDTATNLQEGKNKLDYLFSLGKIDKEFYFSKYFPNISFAISALIVKIFPQKIEYEVLHLSNLLFSLSGVFAISKISKQLFDTKTALIVFFMFMFYPIFFGHMALHGKDMVVAISYIWILYLVINYLKKQHENGKKKKYIFIIGFLLALGTGVRIAFAALLIPVFFFIILEIFYFKKLINSNFSIKKFLFDFLKIILIAYVILIIFWTQTHSNILTMPFKIFLETLKSSPSLSIGPPLVLFNGEFYYTNNVPRYFILSNFFFKTPEYILIMYIFSFYFFIKYNSFFRNKFKHFNYKLYLILLILVFSNVLFILSPYPLYDGLRLALFLIPFFIIIPSLGIYFLINNKHLVQFKLCLFFVALLIIIFLIKFISLTPYQYVYLNAFNGKTQNNSLKFENDYLGTSLNELIKKSNFLNDKYTKLAFCGVEKTNVKYYLDKYKFSKVRVVRDDEKYDYIIMTNRVYWYVNNLNEAKTCFQKYKGKDVSYVKRFGLTLSIIKEK